jgi:hypothetical protein
LQSSGEEDTGDPVAIALKNYEKVTTYQVTLRSKSDHILEEIRYYYKSGFMRMEFIKPLHGAILTYNPIKKEVRLRPFRFTDRTVTLNPDNDMIHSSAGHKVDESDIGSLLKVVARLQSIGKTIILGDEDLSGRPTVHVRVTGNEEYTISGVHQYDLWLDKKTCLPHKSISCDLRGNVIEEVLMDDLEIEIDLPDDLFHL